MTELKKTPLHKIHHQLSAKMLEFGGFEMPIQYTSIVEEHHKVRKEVGLFDLCHMGRIMIKGKDSLDYLQFIVSNNIGKMKLGDAKYSLILNERGTVLDDVIVYHLGESYMVVCNASNRTKIVSWMEKHRESYEVGITDVSDKLGMIAIQGFKSAQVVSKLVEDSIEDLKYYSCMHTKWMGEPVLVARTGYTGEDGFELYLDNSLLEKAWSEAMEKGKDCGIAPVGLAARDTLRLEASMPLYGQEITEDRNPLEAGLGFAVKFKKKGDYIGKSALLEIKKEGLKRKLVCMEVDGKRIARTHAKIFQGDQEVGEVTSGTFSPTLQKSIAMAYVPKDQAEEGTQFEVKIGRKSYSIQIIRRPFYSRK